MRTELLLSSVLEDEDMRTRIPSGHLICLYFEYALHDFSYMHIYSLFVSCKNEKKKSGKIMENSWNLIPEFGWKR